jgi:hypothetical protein
VRGAVAADDPKPDQPEPPIRLKKRDKPKVEPPPDKKPEPPKDEAKKKDAKGEEPEAPEQAEDPKVVLERVAKNMKDAADRLAKTDAGDGTRQVQRDIIKDLDELLKQMRQQSGNPNAASQSNQQQQQDDKQGQSGNRRMQQRMARRQQRGGRNRMARGNQGQRNQPQQDGQAQNGGTTPGGGGKGGKAMADKRPDAYKDIWGHLPEALRMQMDAYAKEKFMAKYDELLKQYYATIAEKERR